MTVTGTKYEIIEKQNEDQNSEPSENVSIVEPFKTAKSEDTNWTIRSVYRALEGKLMILLAGTIIVFCSSMVKKVSDIPVGEFTAIVFLFSLPILVSTALFSLEKPASFQGKAKFVIVRAVLGSLSGLIKLWSFRLMHVGDVQAMMSPVAVFAAIFSRVLWGEKISVFTVISLVLSIVGIALIVKPSFIFGSDGLEQYNPYFALIPLGSCILLGLSFSFMRKIGTNTVSVLTMSSYISLTISTFGIAFQLITQEPFVLPGCMNTRFYLVCTGVGFSASLMLLNRGLLLEKSGPGVLLRNFDMVTAFLIQVFLFEEPVELLSIGGSLLIFLAVVVVTLDKLFFSKRANSCQF